MEKQMISELYFQYEKAKSCKAHDVNATIVHVKETKRLSTTRECKEDIKDYRF
jgi:hypothetical protein